MRSPASASPAEPPPATSSAVEAATSSSGVSRAPCCITAQQWDTVAVWSWDVQTRVCAICKNNLADHCINCLAKASSTSPSAAANSQSAVGKNSTTGGTGGAAGPQTTAPPLSMASAAAVSAGGASHTRPTSTTPATLADLSEKCCVAWGTCGHVFHYHCVSRWLQMRSMCPVCGRQWQLHKITSNE